MVFDKKENVLFVEAGAFENPVKPAKALVFPESSFSWKNLSLYTMKKHYLLKST